jgi:hypothetical protein
LACKACKTSVTLGEFPEAVIIWMDEICQKSYWRPDGYKAFALQIPKTAGELGDVFRTRWDRKSGFPAYKEDEARA